MQGEMTARDINCRGLRVDQATGEMAVWRHRTRPLGDQSAEGTLRMSREGDQCSHLRGQSTGMSGLVTITTGTLLEAWSSANCENWGIIIACLDFYNIC